MMKQTRKAERDRMRLEQGSNYASDEEEKYEDEEDSENGDFDDSYYDTEDGEGAEDVESDDGAGSTYQSAA